MIYLLYDYKDQDRPFQLAHVVNHTVRVIDWFSLDNCEHLTPFTAQGDEFKCIEDWLAVWEDGRWQVIDTFTARIPDLRQYIPSKFPELFI